MSIWEHGCLEHDQKIKDDVNDKTALLILLGIIILATVLRLYKLDSGLWLDEILTFSNYARMPFGQIISTYDSENQHFLYSILARMSFTMFGESARTVRLPAVLFGIGSIWFLYLFGQEVTSRRETLLSVALFAFSYHHVWFSQNARGYTGLLFWTISSSLFFIRALRGGRPQDWLFYAITAALGVYTHMTMAFMIFGHFVMYATTLYMHRKDQLPNRWVGLSLGFGLAGFLTIFLYALVIPQILLVVGGSQASVVSEWKNPLWTLFEFINGLQISLSGGVLTATVVVIAAMLVFVVGLLSYLGKEWTVAGMLLIPAITGAAVTIAIGHHLWPRFFLFTFGFGVLIVVRGIMVSADLLGLLFGQSPQRTKLFGTAANVILIIVSTASAFLAFGPKQDYEGALTYVESHQKEGDTIVTFGIAAGVYKDFYNLDWEIAYTQEDLANIQAQAERTWVLYTFSPVAESVQPDVMAAIESNFRPVEAFPGTVRQGTVYVALSEQSVEQSFENSK
jgi:uncharacterized membrane protein